MQGQISFSKNGGRKGGMHRTSLRRKTDFDSEERLADRGFLEISLSDI